MLDTGCRGDELVKAGGRSVEAEVESRMLGDGGLNAELVEAGGR